MILMSWSDRSVKNHRFPPVVEVQARELRPVSGNFSGSYHRFFHSLVPFSQPTGMAVARRSWSRLALHSIRQNTVTPREAVPNRISSTTLRSTNIIVPVRPMSSSTTNTTLAHESCVPCRKTAPKLTDGEVESGLNVTGGPEEPYSLAAQGWTVIEAQPGERAFVSLPQ